MCHRAANIKANPDVVTLHDRCPIPRRQSLMQVVKLCRVIADRLELEDLLITIVAKKSNMVASRLLVQHAKFAPHIMLSAELSFEGKEGAATLRRRKRKD